MRGPQPRAIELTGAERRGLEALARRHPTPHQVAQRARSARAVDVETARLWRGRWLDLHAVDLADLSVERRLADAPRSGAPARLSAGQVGQVVALACGAPAATGRPISQWTDRELADEVIQRGSAATVSPRHAGRLLNRGTSRPIASAPGRPRPAMTSTSPPGWPTSARSTAPRRPWPSVASGW